MRQVAKTVLLAWLCCLSIAQLHAKTPAQLKLQVRLDAGVVKVADLWDNAGAKAETVIGPAPPPGRSFAVEAGQLAYIAHLYDVDWKPTSGVERALVERTGRPLTHDEITEPLQRSVVQAGASPDASVDLTSVEPILVPPSSFPLVAIEALSYDAVSQRFFAEVAISTEGMQTQRIRVSGQIVRMITAVVATRRLEPGEVIAPNDVRTLPMPERRLTGTVASDIAQVVGQTPKHTIIAGQPVAVGDIGAPLLVAKGATVVMVVETPGMSLAAQGLALGSGGRGDTIQVMNPLSRAIVSAQVTDAGRASVIPGSTPLAPATRVSLRNPEISN